MKLEEVKEKKVKLEPVTFKVTLLSDGQLGYAKLLDFSNMIVRDLERLANEDIPDWVFNQRLISVMQGCLQEPKGLLVKDLSIQDFYQCVIALRVNSLRDKMFELVLEHCNNKFNFSTDLLALPETKINKDFVEPFDVDDGISIQMPRCDLLQKQEFFESKSPKTFIVNEAMKGKLNFDTPAWVVPAVAKALAKFDYGVDITLKPVCPKCKVVLLEAPMPFTSDFFF